MEGTSTSSHAHCPRTLTRNLGFLFSCIDWLKYVVCAFKKRWLLLCFSTQSYLTPISFTTTHWCILFTRTWMKVKIAVLSLCATTGSIMQIYFFSAMLPVEEGSGDAETLSEEEGLLKCCTWNDCCTDRLQIKSISIQSDLLKLKGEHKHRVHPKGWLTELHPCDNPMKRYWSQAEHLHSWLL